MGSPLDLTGQQFGRLTAIVVSEIRPRRGWICRCSCGTVCTVTTDKLLSGHTRSCGCLQREITIRRSTTHGLRHQDEYEIWCAIKARCNNPKHIAYARYGGRGIRVCDEWQHDFPRFFADMGPRPPGLTIERKDNDKGYSADNCRWATYKEQSANSSKPRYIEWNKERRSITDWAKHLHMPRLALQGRFNNGWTIERALTEPYPAQSGPKRGVKRGPYKRLRTLMGPSDEPR
jgi:hypothetical protein